MTAEEGPLQRRRLDLPVPQRLRGLLLGDHADRSAAAQVRLRPHPRSSAREVGRTRRCGRRGPVAPVTPHLATYLERWLDEVVEPNLAPLSHATYETLVRLYITPGLGNIRLDRLRVRDVQTWMNSLAYTCQCCAQGKDARRAARDPALSRCCARGECCRSYASARTIKDARTVLRSALSTAISEELITKNVASLAKAPKLRARKVVAWSTEEARRFLVSARQQRHPLHRLRPDPRPWTAQGRGSRPHVAGRRPRPR